MWMNNGFLKLADVLIIFGSVMICFIFIVFIVSGL